MNTALKSLSAIFGSAVLLLANFAVTAANAAPLKEAKVTQVIEDVKLLPGQSAPRPAAVSDTVKGDTAVRTGVNSRSELTFSDLTITRLGAQTIFSFHEGTRTIDLGGGAILLTVPKKSGGAQIKTAAVTAAITGTTVVFETHNFPKDVGYHADSDFKADAWYKFMVLEGEATFCRKNHPNECVRVAGGQMLIGKAGDPLGTPVSFDVASYITSNVFFTGFGALPPGTLDLIRVTANGQSGPLVDGSAATLQSLPPGVLAGNINTTNTLGSINPANTMHDKPVSEEQDEVVICHKGKVTLTLPRKAAEAHLKNHPTDHLGPCTD